MLLHFVILGGNRRGWLYIFAQGLTLVMVAVVLRVWQVMLRDNVVCVWERGRILLHVVNYGGIKYG